VQPEKLSAAMTATAMKPESWPANLTIVGFLSHCYRLMARRKVRSL
jgi:hypothetical protein